MSTALIPEPSVPAVAHLLATVARKRRNPYQIHLRSLPEYQEFGFSVLASKVLTDFQPYLNPEGKTVLDIGCGNGAKTCYYAEHFLATRIIGLDILPSDTRYAKRFAAEKGLSSKIQFVQAACPPLPIEDESIDIVLSNSVLEHVPERNLDAWCRETFRVLAPGGRQFLRLHPFRSRFGGHHTLYLPLPWIHLWMPEAVILAAWREAYREALKAGNDGVHDPSEVFRAQTLGDLCGGLNRVKITRFERSIRDAGYAIVSRKPSNRKWTGALCRWQMFADYLCDNMSYVLEKP